MKIKLSSHTNTLIFIALLILLGFSLMVSSTFKVSKINKQTERYNTLILPDFHLFDQNGKIVTKSDIFGKYTIIFFGFSTCPSICPMYLAELTKFLDATLGNNAFDNLQVYFITLDPENDTVTVLNKYSKKFSSKIKMLTGDVDTIKNIVESYKVHVVRDKEGNINHSGVLYLVGKEAEFITSLDISNEYDFYCDVKKMIK